MKKILSLLLFSAFYLNSMAQSGKSSIDILIGPSFPTGKFADKNYSDDEAGLAKTGFAVDLSYNNRFAKYIGLTAAFKGGVYGIDMSAYQAPSGVGASMKVETTTWKTGSIMAGIFQEFPLSDGGKLSLQFRELAGVQFAKSPEMKIAISVPGMGNFNGAQESDNATSFVYALGGGFKYQFNSALGLKLFADYSSSNPKFNVSATAGSESAQQEASQRISVVNLGVGLTVGF